MSARNRLEQKQVYFRYDGVQVKDRAQTNSMVNTLPSVQATKRMDNCCGIHGAMKKRRGAKKATSAARRRNDKILIKNALTD